MEKNRIVSEREPSFGEPEDAEKHTEQQKLVSGTRAYSEVCCHSSVGIVCQNTEVPFTTHEYNFEIVISIYLNTHWICKKQTKTTTIE